MPITHPRGLTESGGHAIDETTRSLSFDRMLHDSLPPSAPLSIVKVKGRFGYSQGCGIRHGDLLAVSEEQATGPDDLMLVRVGQAFHIRRAKFAAQMADGYRNLRLVGRDADPICEILGRIAAVFRLRRR